MGETRPERFGADRRIKTTNFFLFHHLKKKTVKKKKKKKTQPVLLPLRDELPAMALLTLLYAIQGIPLGLTMGSV